MGRLLRLRPRPGGFSALNAASTEVYNPDPSLFVYSKPATFLDSRYNPGGSALTWASDVTLTDAGNAATNHTALQNAVNAAATRVGHSRIKLPNGWVSGGDGGLVLKKHTQGDYWTYIEAVSLPSSEGVRCATGSMGSSPVLRVTVNGGTGKAVACEQGADRTRFVGVHFTMTSGLTDNFGMVVLEADTQTSVSHQPRYIYFDRCWVDGRNPGNSLGGVQNGLKANCAEFAYVDGVIDGVYWTGTESHAAICWNGFGPHKWVNNRIEGGAACLFYGGAGPSLANCIPQDIEIRRNHFTRPLSWIKTSGSWDGVTRGVKNNLEFKCIDRALVEGNVFSYCCQDGQNGALIVYKSSAPSAGNEFMLTRNVTHRYNRVKETCSGIEVIAKDQADAAPVAEYVNRIHIHDNVMDEFGKTDYIAAGSYARAWAVQGLSFDIRIEHNTDVLPASGTNLGHQHLAEGTPAVSTNIDIVNNLFASLSSYGIIGDGGFFGQAALDRYYADYSYLGNALIRPADGVSYPAGNSYPSDIASIGFTNVGTKDYTLSVVSPHHNAATDGRDRGANIALVTLATSGVE